MSKLPSASSNAKQRAAALQRQVQSVERELLSATEVFGSGFGSLDELLPAGGFVCGELVEWLADEGVGAATLALWAAWQATRDGGVVVVMDRHEKFFPPAAAAWGIDLEKMIVVRPTSWSDYLWSLDQALRCRAVAAVWAPLEQVSQHDFRRLQLAAEQGQTAGMLIRSLRWLKQPSWAHVQLLVQPVTAAASTAPLSDSVGTPSPVNAVNSVHYRRRWRIKVTRCRGLPPQRATTIDLA